VSYVNGGDNGTILKVSRKPDGEPEIFLSLQGEGAALGTPSVFLRLATCNLSCTYCDTKYTWDWKNFTYEREVMELTLDVVADRILANGCGHLVITGGEPLLQQRALGSLVGHLKEKDFSFEVETNGTIVPGPALLDAVDQWNVSPKLVGSGNEDQRRHVPAALRSFSGLPNAYFKFVITNESDILEVQGLMKEYQLRKQQVILMPEGTSAQVLQERGRWLSQVCIDHGLRFSPRLHILLWGDKRGM
jgi:7-carboxy-7-deazaguanine synthase